MDDYEKLIADSKADVASSLDGLITARLLAFHKKLMKDYGLVRVNFDDQPGVLTDDD